MKQEIIENIMSGLIDEVDLLEFVTDNDFDIAVAVASAPNATPEILDIASRDNDYRVRMAAVNNSNVEKKTLRYLCHDINKEIANIAVCRLEREV